MRNHGSLQTKKNCLYILLLSGQQIEKNVITKLGKNLDNRWFRNNSFIKVHI